MNVGSFRIGTERDALGFYHPAVGLQSDFTEAELEDLESALEDNEVSGWNSAPYQGVPLSPFTRVRPDSNNSETSVFTGDIGDYLENGEKDDVYEVGVLRIPDRGYSESDIFVRVEYGPESVRRFSNSMDIFPGNFLADNFRGILKLGVQDSSGHIYDELTK